MASLVPRAFSLAPLYARSLGKSALAARTSRVPFLESRHSVNTYSICDFTLEKEWRSIASLQKSRWNHRSYAWTDALSGMVFVPAQELSGVVRTWLNSWVVLLFVWKFRRSHDKLFLFISSMLKITPELSCLIHWSQFVTCLTEQEVTRSWKNVQLLQRKVTFELACEQARR